ncbi:MAG TPA: DUF5985 family protein [Candidatus Binataceae bacterium]|nr:DUF5985 family protein [Candidatus Binataceae bacterium]
MHILASVVYLLCAVASLFCTLLLFSTYAKDRTPLLLWSTLCFVGLTINNLLLFTDLTILTQIDLRLPRAICALASVSVLLYGFIWEADRR